MFLIICIIATMRQWKLKTYYCGAGAGQWTPDNSLQQSRDKHANNKSPRPVAINKPGVVAGRRVSSQDRVVLVARARRGRFGGGQLERQMQEGPARFL
jgi:hypothetical protein